MAKMPVTSKARISPELRRRISPALLMCAVDERRAFKALGIALAAFFLYGPITVHPDHNGFLYLVGPWIFPSFTAIFYTFVPFRPYRGVVWEKNMHDIDTNDPSVMRLVELYRSDEARRQLWHESLRVSGILFAILGTAAILLRDSLNWTLPSPQNHFLGSAGHGFWSRSVVSAVACYIALSTAYIGWGLTTWASRETGALSA